MNETLNSKKLLQENNEETVNNQHIHKTHLSFYNLTSSTQSHCRNSEHMFSCINGAPEAYKCKICNFTSALKVNLIDHAVQVHNIPKMKHNLALIMKKLECQNCSLQTYSFLIFKLHRCNYYQLTRNASIENKENNKWYYCTLCSYKSKQENNLKRHFRHKHPSGAMFKCDHCIFECVDSTHFERHLTRHSAAVRENKANWFYCEFCKYKSAYSSVLKKHLLLRHEDDHKINWFRCEHCDFKSRLKSRLTVHVECIHSDKRNVNREEHEWYYCTLCAQKSIRPGNLKKHFTLKHPSGTMFKCDHCKFKCVDNEHFERHLKRHSAKVRENKVNWLYCEFCKYKTAYLSNLKTHLLLMHKDDYKINWFHCELCDFKSKLKSSLTVHVKYIHSDKRNVNHAEQKWHYCTLCSQKSIWADCLKLHFRRKHPSGTMFKCDDCRFTCVDSTHFERHLTWHYGRVRENKANWLYCEFCKYKSAYSSVLNKHLLLRHEDEHKINWFCCKHCDFKSKSKVGLKLHVKAIHSGKRNVKWFNCEHCEFKSANRTRFKHHLLEQDEQHICQWINCKYCNYKCKYPCKMKVHMTNKHTDKEIRWFNCELCGSKFRMIDNLKRHVWTQHI